MCFGEDLLCRSMFTPTDQVLIGIRNCLTLTKSLLFINALDVALALLNLCFS